MCIARVMEKGLLVCTHGRLVDVWTFGRWSAWKDVCVCTIEKLCNSKIESLLSRDARCLNCITLHETECLCVFRAPGEPEDLHRFIVISWNSALRLLSTQPPTLITTQTHKQYMHICMHSRYKQRAVQCSRAHVPRPILQPPASSLTRIRTRSHAFARSLTYAWRACCLLAWPASA